MQSLAGERYHPEDSLRVLVSSCRHGACGSKAPVPPHCTFREEVRNTTLSRKRGADSAPSWVILNRAAFCCPDCMVRDNAGHLPADPGERMMERGQIRDFNAFLTLQLTQAHSIISSGAQDARVCREIAS